MNNLRTFDFLTKISINSFSVLDFSYEGPKRQSIIKLFIFERVGFFWGVSFGGRDFFHILNYAETPWNITVWSYITHPRASCSLEGWFWHLIDFLGSQAPEVCDKGSRQPNEQRRDSLNSTTKPQSPDCWITTNL